MLQKLTKVSPQGVSPHGLNGSIGFFGLVIFTSAGSFTQVDPISSLVTGAIKTFGINKGFKKIDRMVINPLPIFGKKFSNAAQKMRGKILDADPIQDKEPGVIGYKMEVLFSGIRRPADKFIPAANMAV